MAHLAFVGTRQEYRDFLEKRYQDKAWGNPLCAWVVDYFCGQSPHVETIALDDVQSVIASFAGGQYADGDSMSIEMGFALPGWARSLGQFYWDDDQQTEWTCADALAHLAAYAPE